MRLPVPGAPSRPAVPRGKARAQGKGLPLCHFRLTLNRKFRNFAIGAGLVPQEMQDSRRHPTRVWADRCDSRNESRHRRHLDLRPYALGIPNIYKSNKMIPRAPRVRAGRSRRFG